MRIAIILLGLIIACGAAQADICNLAGFIFDAGPAKEGTQVSITNLEYGVTYRTVTGTGWQFENYYLQTITCTVNKDKVEVKAEVDGRIASRTIIPDSRLVQVNLSLPAIREERTPSGGGGGGGGGGGIIPDIAIDTQKVAPYSVSLDSNLSIFTLDRWFNLERYFISVKEIGKDRVVLEFTTGTIDLLKGERTETDINNDGIADYSILLESINGSIAYIRFYKAWNPILEEEGVDLDEKPKALESPAPIVPDSPRLLFIMLAIVLTLTAILIMKDRRDRR